MSQAATATSGDEHRNHPIIEDEPVVKTKPAGTILVLDDDHLERAAVAAALGACNPAFDVICVGTVQEARSALKENDIVLALVDYYLGDGLGLELIAEAGDVPTVIITGAGNEEIAVDAMHAGAYDYVVKDMHSGYLNALPATVGHVLARKRAEVAAETRTRELSRANRELEEFAYVVSHDLKTPLRAIRGFIQILCEDAAARLEDDDKDHLSRIDRSADHMDRLICELLEYSRIGRLGTRAEHVETSEVVDDVVVEVLSTMDDDVARVQTLGSLPAVEATTVQVRQLFQNLIGNALKFRDTEPARVTVSARPLGAVVEFCVADNGIGIEACNHDAIFRVFSRVGTTEDYEGTGIGLSVCKKICEQLGGTIRVESTPGSGTEFFFTLPAAKPRTV